jgi:hypothetical protein
LQGRNTLPFGLALLRGQLLTSCLRRSERVRVYHGFG